MVTGWVSASAARVAPPVREREAPVETAPASLVEAAVDVTDLLAGAGGEEVSALATAAWSTDVGAAPWVRRWLQRRAGEQAALARVLAAGSSGALHLRLDTDPAVLWLARHRRGVLVHALMATSWADRAPVLPGVATMAARLGLRVVPRARTTAWRALAAVRADAAWLVTGLRARGAGAHDRALAAECARYVFAFGDGEARMSPERAVGYLAAGISAQEAWASEQRPAEERPSSDVLAVLAALRGA